MNLQRNPTANGAGKDNIPKGLPVKPPPTDSQTTSLQDQLFRLRRLCLLVGIALGGFLVVAVAAFFYFRNTQPGQTLAGEPEAITTTRDPRPSAEKPNSLKTIPSFIETPVSKRLPSPFPALESKGREPYLETIGGLSAVHLYQTYLNIGLLADAVENETYTYTEAVNVMLTVTELLTLVEKQLKKVSSTGLTTDDAAALESVRHLTGLLRTQSSALVSYWASREEAHATRYQTTREESWNAIKEMMGLEE